MQDVCCLVCPELLFLFKVMDILLATRAESSRIVKSVVNVNSLVL